MALCSGAEPDSTRQQQPLNSRSTTRWGSSFIEGNPVESDIRFYRRRANEELAAADRAVTEAARERRIQLAGAFLQRLKAVEAQAMLSDREMHALMSVEDRRSAWIEGRRVHA